MSTAATLLVSNIWWYYTQYHQRREYSWWYLADGRLQPGASILFFQTRENEIQTRQQQPVNDLAQQYVASSQHAVIYITHHNTALCSQLTVFYHTQCTMTRSDSVKLFVKQMHKTLFEAQCTECIQSKYRYQCMGASNCVHQSVTPCLCHHTSCTERFGHNSFLRHSEASSTFKVTTI